MPRVIIAVTADDTIQDPAPSADAPQPPSRMYLKGRRYEADVGDARKLIAAGSATVEEVPHQDGLPRGTVDSAALLAELRRLAPRNAEAPSQPVPLPDPPASPDKE